METRIRKGARRNDRNKNAPKPLRINHLRQPLKECITLLLDLLAQAVVRDEVYIHESVLFGYRDVAPVGNEVQRFGHAKLCAK